MNEEQKIRFDLYREACQRNSPDPVKEAADAWRFIESGVKPRKSAPADQLVLISDTTDDE